MSKPICRPRKLQACQGRKTRACVRLRKACARTSARELSGRHLDSSSMRTKLEYSGPAEKYWAIVERLTPVGAVDLDRKTGRYAVYWYRDEDEDKKELVGSFHVSESADERYDLQRAIKILENYFSKSLNEEGLKARSNAWKAQINGDEELIYITRTPDGEKWVARWNGKIILESYTDEGACFMAAESKLKEILGHQELSGAKHYGTISGRTGKLYIWRYNRRSGLWDNVRDTLPENQERWLEILRRDEPNETFVVSARNMRVAKAPAKYPELSGAKHSDKALDTIRQMGTEPEQWVLCPIEWTKELAWVEGKVRCPDCRGNKYVRYDEAGKLVPRPAEILERSDPEYYHRDAELRTWDHKVRWDAREAGHKFGNCKRCMKEKRGWGFLPTGEIPGMVQRTVDVGRILWPPGCSFDSRFKSNMNCGLCNKLIMKSHQIPVIAKDASGQWHGMQVGSDCVKKFLTNVETIKGLNEDKYFADALARSEAWKDRLKDQS